MAHRTRRFATTIVVNILLVVSLVFLGAVSGAAAQAPSAAQAPVGASGEGAIADAVQWLQGQQASDGSFGGSVGNTAEVALAAAAAGQDLSMWRASGGRTIFDYLTAQADGYAVDAATTGKLVTALAAAGLDPRQTGDVDLVARLRGYDDGEGVFSTTALAQAWGILGLAAAESPVPQGAADALIAFQQADGGWEGGPGWGTDSNTTALAAQALVAAGVPADAAALSKAREYLRAQLAPAGGFVYSAAFGDVADANSTAYGIQGLLALGEDPASASWAQSDRTPRDALLAFQIADGAFEWQAGEGASLLATAQAVPALARATYPLRAPEEAEPAPVALQDGQAASNTLVGRRAGAQGQPGGRTHRAARDVPRVAGVGRAPWAAGDRRGAHAAHLSLLPGELGVGQRAALSRGRGSGRAPALLRRDGDHGRGAGEPAARTRPPRWAGADDRRVVPASANG